METPLSTDFSTQIALLDGNDIPYFCVYYQGGRSENGDSVEVDASIYIGKSQHYNGSLYRVKEGEWKAEREIREKRE